MNAAIARDRDLARRAADGSVASWHQFVRRYAPVILTIVRRQLFYEDEDVVRDVFTEILQELYAGGLKKYDGRARLGTWLVIVARRRTLDRIRRDRGRQRLPAGYSGLTRFEQRVFRYLYIEGMPLSAAVDTLNRVEHHVTIDRVVDAVARIEAVVAPRALDRIAGDQGARRLGMASAREAKLRDHLCGEARRRQQEARPDVVMQRRDRDAMAARTRAMVRELTVTEQRVIELRFSENRTAREISVALGLDAPRKVYTILETAVRKLRRGVAATWLETTRDENA